MNLEDLKDQLKEQIDISKRQIQESSVYITLKERYDLLTPQAQKGLNIGAIVVVAMLFFYLPFSAIMSTSDQFSEFADNKSLGRELLRVSREFKQGPKVPLPIDMPTLQAQVQSTINASHLLPEQAPQDSISMVQPKIAKLTPPGIKASAVKVSLIKLNLNQIVDIGYQFLAIDEKCWCS